MKLKKKLAFLFLLLTTCCHASDWSLGSMEFTFRQQKTRNESSSQAARTLPELILERISSDGIRYLPESEILDRKLKELQTERLSLFLQLSKESQARDALVLSSLTPRKFKKSVRDQEEKISEIQQKIKENLAKVDEEIASSKEKDARIKAISPSQKNNDGFLSGFSFFRKTEENLIVEENVVLHKSDTKALFKPSDSAMDSGFESWDFEKEVTALKINGLLAGTITSYGDYCSVTVDLRIYPGAKILGSVTEVGMLSELIPLADRIARNMASKIANSLPVKLEFDIEPAVAAEGGKITIDGIVHSFVSTTGGRGKGERNTLVEAGVHRIVIESPGYESLSFSYRFADQNVFTVKARMEVEDKKKINIRLKKYKDGVFYADGLDSGVVSPENPYARLTINGNSVLGVFKADESTAEADRKSFFSNIFSKRTDEDDLNRSNIAFFKIPEPGAFDGAYLIVNAKPYDREDDINKRRRWMYTAYSALICSLPFTFYNIGNFTAENNAYALENSRTTYDDVMKWQKRSYVSLGFTAAFGAWSIIELVRYLYAADKVLPVKARIDRKSAMMLQQMELNSKIEALADIQSETPAAEGNPEGSGEKAAEIQIPVDEVHVNQMIN